jgi:hypothetical protein
MTKRTKKLIIGLIMVLIGLAMIFAGCGKRKAEASGNRRFMRIEGDFNWNIYADRETGVMYAVSNGVGNAGTFTLLVDANGDPLIYEGDEE